MTKTHIEVRSPMQAQLVSLHATVGQTISAGDTVATIELMKMQHLITSPINGIVIDVHVEAGQMVEASQFLMSIEPGAGNTLDETAQSDGKASTNHNLDALRAAHALTLDAARPDAQAKRHRQGKRTARENIAALIDPGSFREYGQLVFAAQRTRRGIDDLKQRTPADGLVCGLATINAEQFNEHTECVVLHYDYTVLAGTQGAMNHAKTDRLLKVASEAQSPVIFFTEGGGGRPGDVDVQTLAGLHVPSFAALARLSGQVPLIGVASGNCFAGNAAFLGCCDVVIATEDASIGMGGPAMIEGGGLGVFSPAEVGPAATQAGNGVVDILVADEAQAVFTTKKYLSYFQGVTVDWQAPDNGSLDGLIPANRLQVYDMHEVIKGIADVDSVTELRAGFGIGMITALIRIEGRPMGIIANNPTHLAGAIDHDGADKAARFMQLCDAHNLPLVSLCDTPGIMVGPESEAKANVRHASRLFVTGANLDIPLVMVVIRKAYGLGAMAMGGGGFHETKATVSWPSGEFGAMGLEGAVRLGYSKELAAIEDETEREAAFQARVDAAYEHGKALNAATYFEFDAVIEPVETRAWISSAIGSGAIAKTSKRRPNIDTW